jgi:hypothetical protein
MNVLGSLNTGDGGDTFLRNIGNQLKDLSRRPQWCLQLHENPTSHLYRVFYIFRFQLRVLVPITVSPTCARRMLVSPTIVVWRWFVVFPHVCPVLVSCIKQVIKLYLTVPLWLIIVELLSYRQHTQSIMRSNVYIYYSVITLRLVSESWFHHQEGH